MLLLVEDMLLLGVLQESLILLGSVQFLELLTLLLENTYVVHNYYIYMPTTRAVISTEGRV